MTHDWFKASDHLALDGQGNPAHAQRDVAKRDGIEIAGRPESCNQSLARAISAFPAWLPQETDMQEDSPPTHSVMTSRRGLLALAVGGALTTAIEAPPAFAQVRSSCQRRAMPSNRFPF